MKYSQGTATRLGILRIQLSSDRRTDSESLSLQMKLGTARFNSSSQEGAARCWRACSMGQAMKCPHCHQEIGIATADLAAHAFLLRTKCEKCGKEFLIVERLPMTDEQYSSHTSQ